VPSPGDYLIRRGGREKKGTYGGSVREERVKATKAGHEKNNEGSCKGILREAGVRSRDQNRLAPERKTNQAAAMMWFRGEGARAAPERQELLRRDLTYRQTLRFFVNFGDAEKGELHRRWWNNTPRRTDPDIRERGKVTLIPLEQEASSEPTGNSQGRNW